MEAVQAHTQGSYSITGKTLNQRYSPDYEIDTDCMEEQYKKHGLNPAKNLEKYRNYIKNNLEVVLANVNYEFTLNGDTLVQTKLESS